MVSFLSVLVTRFQCEDTEMVLNACQSSLFVKNVCISVTIRPYTSADIRRVDD